MTVLEGGQMVIFVSKFIPLSLEYGSTSRGKPTAYSLAMYMYLAFSLFLKDSKYWLIRLQFNTNSKYSIH